MYWRLILHIKVFLWLNEPLAALISLATLQNALNNFGYAAVALFIMIESSGIPFPGETMLLLASFYAAVSHQLQIPVVIACAAFGAIIGDNIGYLIGRTGGRAFVVRYGKYVFIKPEHLALAEAYFAKHGNKTVFFGRFIALLRAWAAFLAISLTTRSLPNLKESLSSPSSFHWSLMLRLSSNTITCNVFCGSKMAKENK